MKPDKRREPIYSGPSRFTSRPYDFTEFVHGEISNLLQNSGMDKNFDEEGLDMINVTYNIYYFRGAGFIIEHEFNRETDESEICLIGSNSDAKTRVANLFRLHMDVQERKN